MNEAPPNDMVIKGIEREATLPPDVYYSDHYFSRRQLFSQMAQLNLIHDLKPRRILEIGIGNGLVSEVLRGAGYEVTTMDINPELSPEVLGDVSRVKDYFDDNSFDLIVACEVLEHLPFDKFAPIIEQFSRITRKHVYMTLPRAQRILMQWVVGIKIPYIPRVDKDFFVRIKSDKLAEEHFWEIDSKPETTRSALVNHMKHHFEIKRFSREITHPYHNHIILEKRRD